MRRLRAAQRILGIMLHLGWGLILLLWVRGQRVPLPQAQGWIQAWHRQLLLILGLRLRRHGTPATGAQLLVANHVSWLDIPVLGSLLPVRFVAKAEVARWPLIGAFAAASGTVFLVRGRGATLGMRATLADHLRAGDRVVLFPEGTTGTGTAALPFHSRLFAPAADAGCAVQPVAIRYRALEGPCIAPFLGNETLPVHLLRVLCAPPMEADLHFCDPIPSAGRSRDELAEAARTAIAGVLALPVTALSAANHDLGRPQTDSCAIEEVLIR